MSKINLNNNIYKYIKFTSITNIYTALVELITNSIDAYNRINSTNKIIYIIVNAKEHSITIIDRASGIKRENLAKCFGQVGEYTSSDGSRGFFSKGAKDVSAIGDMYITSICDNDIASCVLYTNSVFTHPSDIKTLPTQENRDFYNIPNNGTYVKILLNKSFILPEFSEILNIKYYYSLRDIFSDKNTHIQIINGDVIVDIEPIIYYNADKKLIDETFTIDNYKNITARLTIYEKDIPAISNYGVYMEYGIIIKDDIGIYDINTFYNDIRTHPKIYNIYGFLETNGISTLMHEFDNNIINEFNPFPILNPSRMGNINKDHPFIKNLYRRPHMLLKYILEDLFSNELDDIKEYDISDIFSDINVFDDEFYKSLQNLMIPNRIKSLSKISKYLERTSSNVINQDTSSTYTSDDILAEFEEDSTAEYEKKIPKFLIKFVNIDIDPIYRIFINKESVFVQVNVSDYVLSRYCTFTDVIKITNKDMFLATLVDIVTEGFSFNLMKYKNTFSSDEKSIEEIERDFLVYRKLFSKHFYKFFIANDILEFNK